MALTLVSFILLLTVYATANVSGQCTMPYKYGPDCRFDCNCIPRETCDSDRRCTQCRDGWDGPTCQRQNVALGRTASQSSTYFGITKYSSGAAVDGLVGNQLELPCTHTNENTPATWEVTLDQTYTISRFKIYNRAEGFGNRLTGFVVSVWPSSGPYSICYTDNTQLPSGPGNIIYKECQDGATGNRVQIHIASGYLVLCEVLLYVCSDGTYGEECQHYCGECRDSYVCNKKTGVCPDTGGDRCKPSFTGDKCKGCISGRYGDTCQLTCGQCLNTACDRQTGSCSSCKMGYMMPLCQECISGRYGDTCQHTCGQCLNTACDKQTGNCLSCKTGYMMPLCQECNPGRYGDACQQTCGQCQNTVCNKQNGECPACKPDYKMPLCQDCVDGRWGNDCSSSCGNCHNGANCAMGTGECPGIPKCAAGYKGSKCDKDCDDGHWGEDCSHQCGQCRVFTCDKKNGSCQVEKGHPTCVEGYKGIRCMESNCSQSTYGPGCRYECHCGKDVFCDPFSGCNGNCTAGWDGNTCQRQNVALGGTTSQSSTFPYTPELSSSSAVDGRAGHSLSLPCSHTNENDPSPSWTVTLNQTYNIYRFRIYNRDGNWGNRLNGFTLYVGTSSGDYSLCYQDATTSTAGPGNIVNGTCQNGSPISGNTVQIRNSANEFVVLCEVLLYVCSPYWYGEFCQMECITNDRCKRCDNTWLYCAECVTGRWGEQCDKSCGNCRDDSCEKKTGVCPVGEGTSRCKAGYMGTNCTTSCVEGTWGADCKSECGKCSNKAACDSTSGNCPQAIPVCLPGYEKPLCITPCANRTWGTDCESKCGSCYQNVACKAVGGECPDKDPRCEPGYQGSPCNETCNPGTHGSNCAKQCGSCADGPNVCNHESGECPLKQGQSRCMEGYTGLDCKTEVKSDIGVIVGPVIAALLLIGIVAVAVIFYRKRRNTPTKYNDSTPANPRYAVDEDDIDIEVDQGDNASTYENEVSIAVPVHDFAQYVQEKKSKRRFKPEFEKFPEGLHADHKVADLPHNKAKSRYRSLMAYDHSRVVLQGGVEKDYINACYINGYNEPQKFIASQGPTDLIIKDFMRMIWERKVGTVVMVTNLVETTKTKCVQYWPNEGSRRIGEIEVAILEEEVYADFTIRSLRLTHSEEKKRSMDIKQFHFTTWPDHGVPSHATALLDFRDKVLSNDNSEHGPIVVHCSAGIGRTGTFIALDYLINQANTEGALDVPGCVRELRKQRVNMIQTKEQYEFLHEALVEALRLTQGSIPSVDFSRVYSHLRTVDQATGKTHMAGQFQLLEEFTPTLDTSKVKTALKQENAHKNRSSKVLAADSCRPFLSTPVTGGNDYINAVFLPGHRMKRGFILTQTPLPNTVLDFWRLVYEQSICTIVMLDQPETRDKSVGLYLPEKVGTLQPFEVDVIDEEARDEFSVWTYKLTYKTTTVEQPIKHIRCGFWAGKPSAESIQPLLNVIQFVEDWQNQSGSGPILVYCRDGVTKSGLYCAASSVIERLKVDQDVNIVQTIKQLRTCRPSIVPDMFQFDLLHQIVLGYLQTFNTYANFSP